MKSIKARSVRPSSAKSDHQPATRKMLKLVRTELIQRMDAGFSKVEARFNGIEARFNNLEASSTRMELLLEEQAANNRIVLEGLQALWQRQDQLETRFDTVRNP